MMIDEGDDGWAQYIEDTRDDPPNEMLVAAIGLVPSRDAALELGPGAFNDVRHMLDQGFKSIVAVDSATGPQRIAETLPADRLTFILDVFGGYDFPVAHFDLVNAQNALSFTLPHNFDRVVRGAVASLKPGGIFTGNFFGERDAFAPSPEMSFVNMVKALQLLDGTELLHFDEFDGEGTTADGTPKHWHAFDFIVRKK